MKRDRSIKKEFSTVVLVLIPVAIAINIVIGQIVFWLKLPVYLDSIGTMLVAVVAGPWAGALTGTLSNLIWSLFEPTALPWVPVSLAIGFVTGLCAIAGLFKTWWRVIIAGFLVALTAAIVSSPIQVLLGGITASGSSLITAYLIQTGQGIVSSVLSTNFLVEPVDKIATALLAFAILGGLSQRYLTLFPRPENVDFTAGNRTIQLIAAILAAVLVVVVYWLVISPMLPG